MLLPHFRVSSSAPAWEGSREGHIFRAAFCLLPAAFCLLLVPQPVFAHPMGNFSISHNAGLALDVNGRSLFLDVVSTEVIFPPGAGGLATMKFGFLYRARLDGLTAAEMNEMHYRDRNFPDRVGWKEVIAVAGQGIRITSSSVPERDRSQQLANYPTDLLNSPPQALEASVRFEEPGESGLGTGGSGLGSRGWEVRKPINRSSNLSSATSRSAKSGVAGVPS